MPTPHDEDDTTDIADGEDRAVEATPRSRGPRLIEPGRRPRRSEGWGRLARRYGSFAAMAALAVAALVVFGRDEGDEPEPAATNAMTDREAVILSGPMTPEGAELTGETPDFGPTCDPATGRIKMPTVHAPPCVVPFEGNNGGATTTGVTEETIKVVAYVTDPQINPLMGATVGAAGQDLDPGRQAETIQDYVDLYNELFESYGREVEVEVFEGTGAIDDEAAAQADAIAIADMEPFAVVGGPLQASPAFADELAARGVLCVGEGCATGLSEEFLEERAPYVWMGFTQENASELFAEAVANLAGPGKATMAGDPELHEQDRVYGMVYFNDPDGLLTASFELVRDRLAEQGVELAAEVEYFLDLARVQETARTIITRLKEAGVTTVVFGGDPVTPGSLTEEASAQGYFPEWIAGGFAVDSPRFARGYDPEQWTNGFVTTAATAPTPPGSSSAIQLYDWAYGTEPPSGNFANSLEAPLRMLFNGVHLAGPELTPETFGDALLRYPASGGGPTTPLYQPHNSTIGDIAVIQWDPDAAGTDPDGTENVGFYRFTNGGQRYALGEVPNSPDEAGLFEPESSVVQYDQPPPEDQVPEYPPPDL